MDNGLHWYGMAYQSGMALEQLATLVAVVDANGFAAAARATNLRKATISQRIRQTQAGRSFARHDARGAGQHDLRAGCTAVHGEQPGCLRPHRYVDAPDRSRTRR